MWTIREFVKYILLPVVVVESLLLLVWWALPLPAGHPTYDYIRVNMVAAAVALTALGVIQRRIYQRPRWGSTEVLESVPRLAWCGFIGAKVALIGLMLSVAFEALFVPMLLGFCGATALTCWAFVRSAPPPTADRPPPSR